MFNVKTARLALLVAVGVLIVIATTTGPIPPQKQPGAAPAAAALAGGAASGNSEPNLNPLSGDVPVGRREAPQPASGAANAAAAAAAAKKPHPPAASPAAVAAAAAAAASDKKDAAAEGVMGDAPPAPVDPNDPFLPQNRKLAPLESYKPLVDDGVMRINVMIASDANTLIGVIAVVKSILANTKTPDRIDFYLIVDTDQEAVRCQRWLNLAFEKKRQAQFWVKVFPLEWVANKIKIRGRRQDLASPANYARYYVLDLFPNLTGRIAYIDSDVVVQDDVAGLYFHPIEPGHIGAFVKDCHNELRFFINFEHPRVLAQQMDPSTCSFNAGVYVADLTEWKRQRMSKELEFWMELNTRENVYGGEGSGGGSQPPMLLALYGRATELNPLWHVRHLGWSGSYAYTAEFVKSAHLLHWNGAGKPWLLVPGVNFPSVWRQFCTPEPELSATACSEPSDGPSYKYVSDEAMLAEHCTQVREQRAADAEIGIALDCTFPW
ncbi:glycosyltransferase 8 domain-containing protein 1 [Capsaspora owczarzaki ATCC 30864]|uniref:Glycosyltransferase 8 domain-containing protein 1 n=1 Tax=Capsaspora owczarzaki (strain ATCC 30864) TaxID=595528 RepID=A0A0D2WUB1_CAPO3|nr:glycosyltransferase 8 domain-containing protein 1 [Capsaspora owczarzaki ATCC 30864]KJE95478.1 glycosyltransferase 8 domain-containing protein 1 [Capsaspora owczarzaki ATCC 30864]|eukprot:XP_004345518.1 glycosyltransferase 8 domain-containing protein 1 [Capsaspora owczarzaki ATCC 30864]